MSVRPTVREKLGLSIRSTLIEKQGMSVRPTVREKLGLSVRSTVKEKWGMSVCSNPNFGCTFSHGLESREKEIIEIELDNYIQTSKFGIS